MIFSPISASRYRSTAILLILCAVNLALMVPGGFVETRNFPQYSVFVLAGFNVFLTVLGLGSLILAYRVLKARRVGAMPVVVGLSYVAVYGLDLARIFPIAAAPMSALLHRMEWIGVGFGVATALIGLAFATTDRGDRPESRLPQWAGIALAGIALAIVIFATRSAM